MNNKIFSFLKKYSTKPLDINRLVVSAFIEYNQLKVQCNELIKALTISEENTEEYNLLLQFCELFHKNNISFSFERLIEVFEFVISPSDKIVNGAVYTPSNIRMYIIKECLLILSQSSKIGDISCGCGGFLFDMAILLNKKYSLSFSEIFKNNIYGVDLTDYSIKRTEILLSLLAISKGEDKVKFDFNLFVKNSLEFNWRKEVKSIRENDGFDVIVGNPPYVSSLHIEEESRHLLSKWSVSSTGKSDLYIPFFQIGLTSLKPNGILGYITASNFYRSFNGRALRKYLNGTKIKLVDFGDEQVFKGKKTYTCICMIENKMGNIAYTKCPSKSISFLKDTDFVDIKYDGLNNEDGWILDDYNVQSNLKKIETIGKKLGDLFVIRNGLATLRNNIYIFKPIDECDSFYYFKKGDKIYKVEKGVCKNIIKPNILKTEDKIKELTEKIMFPYERKEVLDLFGDNNNGYKVLSESKFRGSFPNAYAYLSEHKSELAKRDKGAKKYEEWFAFGRSQALNIKGKKLFFPYIAKQPYFVFSNQENLLFYNGYAIVSDSEADLRFIQKILISDLFWYYIKHISKPYSGDYFSLAKNYIKNFGIPEFTNEEKKKLMRLKRKSSINNFLQEKYKIVF